MYISIFVFLGLFSSCQDEISITLPDGQKRLIVNGSVLDNALPSADLSWSINYLAEEENPPVLNASIFVFAVIKHLHFLHCFVICINSGQDMHISSLDFATSSLTFNPAAAASVKPSNGSLPQNAN